MIREFTYLFFLHFFILTSLLAQEGDVKKSIAVLGFKRFEFQSDFKLQEIMEVNQLSSQDEVYELYVNTILDEISIQKGELSLFRLPKTESDRLHKRIPVEYKTSPANYLGVDIRYLREMNRINTLLTNLSADYFLALTEYKINTIFITKIATEDGSKMLRWSTHQISYELYDKNGNVVAYGDRIELLPKDPKKGTANTMGVEISMVKDSFINIIDDIDKKINPKKRKKRKR